MQLKNHTHTGYVLQSSWSVITVMQITVHNELQNILSLEHCVRYSNVELIFVDCLFNSFSRLTSRKTQKPALLFFCEGEPPVNASGLISQRTNNATESVSMSWRHHDVIITGVVDQQAFLLGWGLLELLSSISPQAKFSISQKYLLHSLNLIHIWRVSPQLSSGDTCKIWTWYSSARMFFGDVEKLGK